jgi:hypothetical protein
MGRVFWLLATSLAAFGLTLALIAHPELDRPLTYYFSIADLIAAFAFSSVGAVIVARRPRNLIGWMFCLISVTSGLSVAAAGYALYALFVADGALPGGAWAGWFATWVWVPSAGAVPFLFLLFPNGRLVSPVWRPLGWFGAAFIPIGMVYIALMPFETMVPRGPTAIAAFMMAASGVWLVSGMVVMIGYLAEVALTAVALVVRAWRAKGDERAQLKWFAYATGWWATLVIIETFLRSGYLLSSIGTIGIAVSVGVAILRYRLYDIDLVINRTIVYGALTAILAGTYVASVNLSQRLFIAVTGERSDAAVVLTTLVVASLFTPVKSSLQAVVDKRFKEGREAVNPLSQFEERVRGVTDVFDSLQLTRSYLDKAVVGFDADCGAVYLGPEGDSRLVYQRGDWAGAAVQTVPVEHEGTRFAVVALGPRRKGRPYTEQDRQSLLQCASTVARAIALAQRPAPLAVDLTPAIDHEPLPQR